MKTSNNEILLNYNPKTFEIKDNYKYKGKGSYKKHLNKGNNKVFLKKRKTKKIIKK